MGGGACEWGGALRKAGATTHVEMALVRPRRRVLLHRALRVHGRVDQERLVGGLEGAPGEVDVTLGRVDVRVPERARPLRAVVGLPVAAALALVVQGARPVARARVGALSEHAREDRGQGQEEGGDVHGGRRCLGEVSGSAGRLDGLVWVRGRGSGLALCEPPPRASMCLRRRGSGGRARGVAGAACLAARSSRLTPFSGRNLARQP